ncbi:MAG: MgtC/SapB family protein [Candidatus Gastranaerophilales bacterium]|nr:MgtC/SapB family protein [Candidatus Gastranaerophilales bacterium]
MENLVNNFQVPDINILMRIVLSIILGFGIGLERELTNKWAGLRTHILVCLGSCLFTILSIYGFSTAISIYPMGDPGRVAAQILTGIGFIGGGTVLRHGSNVYGLTTAASLWMVASIGMACGCGKINLALYVAVISVAILVLIRIFETEVMPKNLKNMKQVKLSIICDIENSKLVENDIYGTFDEIMEFTKKKVEHADEKRLLVAKISMCCKNPIQCIHEKLEDVKHIDSISVQEIYE